MLSSGLGSSHLSSQPTKVSQPKDGDHILTFQRAKQKTSDVKIGDVDFILSESHKSPSLASFFPDQQQELNHVLPSELLVTVYRGKVLPSTINPDSSPSPFFVSSKVKENCRVCKQHCAWSSMLNKLHYSYVVLGFPAGSVVKNSLVNAGDSQDKGFISGLGRSPGG